MSKSTSNVNSKSRYNLPKIMDQLNRAIEFETQKVGKLHEKIHSYETEVCDLRNQFLQKGEEINKIVSEIEGSTRYINYLKQKLTQSNYKHVFSMTQDEFSKVTEQIDSYYQDEYYLERYISIDELKVDLEFRLKIKIPKTVLIAYIADSNGHCTFDLSDISNIKVKF